MTTALSWRFIRGADFLISLEGFKGHTNSPVPASQNNSQREKKTKTTTKKNVFYRTKTWKYCGFENFPLNYCEFADPAFAVERGEEGEIKGCLCGRRL